MHSIKNRIKVSLYNNRNISIETRKKMENIMKSLDNAVELKKTGANNYNKEFLEILDIDDDDDLFDDLFDDLNNNIDDEIM